MSGLRFHGSILEAEIRYFYEDQISMTEIDNDEKIVDLPEEIGKIDFDAKFIFTYTVFLVTRFYM